VSCNRDTYCELLADVRDPGLIGQTDDKSYAKSVREAFADRDDVCRICKIARKAARMEINQMAREI